MSLMDRFAKLDSAMQRGMDNGFARVFGGRVVPSEIEEALKQNAEDYATDSENGYTYAPNIFRVTVSSKDYDTLRQEAPDLAEDFTDRLTRFIRNNGWQVVGPVRVQITSDDSMHTGQLKSAPGFEEEQYTRPVNHQPQAPQGTPAPRPQPQPQQAPAPETQQYQAPQQSQYPQSPAVNLLLQDGSSRTYMVREGSNIIGRGSAVDFRLPDTGVSRNHAEITWDGQDAVLVDLQSTNGTTVNDIPVDNWLLADGDVITVGHSNIEVRINPRS